MKKKKKKIIVVVALLAAVAFAREPNYDEASVAPYMLEDPLTFADGRKLRDASEWPSRRKEILGIFAREMYGVEPPAPEAVVTELKEDGATLAGLAIRRQYRMWFKPDKSGPFIDWLLVLPNRIAGEKTKSIDGRIACENSAKVPVVLMLNYPGNHAVLDDAEVPLTEGGWFRADGESRDHEPKESDRGVLRRSQMRTTVPAEFIVSRGYAFLTACYAQVSPDVEVRKGDKEELAYSRVFELWGKRDESRTDNTTALGAWAWALSRGLDLAEMIPEIDAKRCVATGSSRLGKAALLASARDERFAVCVPNQTGGGGVPLAKRNFGENVSTEMATFPHWYCKAYAKYIDNEQTMKFDQHLLVAAIAPRSLLVEGFNAGWFDAKGEWLSCRAASPVWEFLGKEGLPKGDFPENYDLSRIGSSLGYVRRGGQHGLSGYDWLWMLDFADKALAPHSVNIIEITDAPFEMPPIVVPQFAASDFSIADFGAKEGVKATDAFAAAMAACEKAGGGRVVVPKGKWLTGAVHFRNNCNLHLADGATLVFTDDPIDYLPVVHTTWEGVECYNYSPLLYGYGVTNVAITGNGMIAPRMDLWRTWFTRPPEHMYATECLYHWCSTNAVMSMRDLTAIKGSNVRPHLIQFNRCANVLLDGFRIRESPFWMIHLYHSENCVVRNLDTYAHGSNNDGVDIEMTRNVLVENCRFDQGDDGIVLKAGRNQDAWRLNRPTENVVVRNCKFVFAHTLLGIGSELSGGIRNVWMHHCKIRSAYNLFYVKTNRRRGGFVKNIYFEDAECDNIRGALCRVETEVLYQWAKFSDYELRRTDISELHVRNVKANCADYAIDIRGDAAAPVRNVELENVWLGSCRKSFERIENAEGIQKRNVRFGDLTPKP